MKITYIISDYTKPGGIDIVVGIRANYLAEKGYEVNIITCNKEYDKPFLILDPRISIYNLELPSTEIKYKDEFINKLSPILYELKSDIVISTGTPLVNYIYEIKDGSKKIVEFHFNKYRGKTFFYSLEKHYLGRLFIKFYYRKFYNQIKQYDKFVVLTEEDKESWLKHKFTNIEVIPNPLTCQSKNISPLSEKRVIAIGRLTGQKAFDKLVDIWKEVQPKYPDWKLTIFGKGGKKEKLVKKINQFNLQDVVEIKDPTKNIVEEFYKSSVFVLTSRYEGFGLVITEAMNCGVPPVVYECKSGPSEIIKNGENGFLIKVDNKKEFTNKLTLLMKNENLRKEIGKAAKERAKDFEVDKVMPKWIKLFNSLTEK